MRLEVKAGQAEKAGEAGGEAGGEGAASSTGWRRL